MIACYRFTEQGIRRRAAERRAALLPPPSAPEPAVAPCEAAEPVSNVIKFRPKLPRPALTPEDLLAPIPRSTARVIIERVAAWHGISYADMIAPGRFKHLAEARQDAAAAVYLNCRIDGREYTLHELGRAFRRDHSTMHHALRKRGVK